MKVLITETFPNIDIHRITKYSSSVHEFIYLKDTHEPRDIEAVVVWGRFMVDKNFLDTYVNIKYVLRVGVGTDNIDLDLCREYDIQVVNRPGSNSYAVSEMAIRGLLSLNRMGINAYEACKVERDIPSRSIFLGKQISSQTIGLLGCGSIGRSIIDKLSGFGPQDILLYDPYLSVAPSGTRLIASIDELISEVDVIILALPLTEATRHIVNASFLASCKSDVKVINVSRGGIVDEEALYDFLSKNELAGAYIDVWNGEPHKTENIEKLMKLKNFIFTPHICAESVSAQDAMHYFEVLSDTDS